MEGLVTLKFRLVLTKMSRNKAEEPYGVVTEMLSAINNLRIDMSTKVINKIYDSGEILEDLGISMFLMMLKKKKGRCK